jgi:hypothetical protein
MMQEKDTTINLENHLENRPLITAPLNSLCDSDSGEEAVQEAAGETSVRRLGYFAGFLSQETSEQGARTCGL